LAKKLLAGTVASLIAFMPVVASAGGPTGVSPEPEVDGAMPVATAVDWSGLYAGLAVAVPMGDNTFTERGVNAEATPGDWEGTSGMLTGGYDWQRNKLVYGAALDLGFGSIDASGTTSGEYGCGTSCDIAVSSYKALRGRIGYASGSALFYGTAGIARADAEADFGNDIIAGADTLSGWVAGIGIEYKVSSRLSLDAAYLHNDLGRLEIPDTCGFECFTDVSFGQFKLGANFRW